MYLGDGGGSGGHLQGIKRLWVRVISGADDDWPAVVSNLSRVRAVLKKMTIILSREEAEPRVSLFLFKSIVQEVLIFLFETWVVTP